MRKSVDKEALRKYHEGSLFSKEKLVFYVATFFTESYDKLIDLRTPRPDKKFLVEADDVVAAESYARRFERIALNWNYGLSVLRSIEEASPGSSLPMLSTYESIFPNR